MVPHDERIRQWIEIPEGMAIPAAAGAVGSHRRAAGGVHRADLDGMIVNAEIVDYPERGDRAVGRVIEVLGRPGRFRRRRRDRDPQAPHPAPVSSEDVLEQARAIPAAIPADEIARRRDFRALDIVTIDGETARDFDDAVWVERLPNGNFALQVHIADVSHYVRPGTPIDREARLRGTSVYFPDRAVPMLPLELSTDHLLAASPASTAWCCRRCSKSTITATSSAQEFTRGVIRSAERMTYTGVHEVLEGDRS